jgi:hypothetical protein
MFTTPDWIKEKTFALSEHDQVPHSQTPYYTTLYEGLHPTTWFIGIDGYIYEFQVFTKLSDGSQGFMITRKEQPRPGIIYNLTHLYAGTPTLLNETYHRFLM